jgi:TRAP-type C4-dicarboxylate transport system substrate-binding protein
MTDQEWFDNLPTEQQQLVLDELTVQQQQLFDGLTQQQHQQVLEELTPTLPNWLFSEDEAQAITQALRLSSARVPDGTAVKLLTLVADHTQPSFERVEQFAIENGLIPTAQA